MNDVVLVDKRDELRAAIQQILNSGCRVDEYMAVQDDAVIHRYLSELTDLRDFGDAVIRTGPGSIRSHGAYSLWQFGTQASIGEQNDLKPLNSGKVHGAVPPFPVDFIDFAAAAE